MDVGDARAVDTCQGKHLTGEDAAQRRKCAAVNKAERTGELWSPLISDMEMYSLEFALLDFGLPLVQPFLTTPSFLPLGMEICFLWHCMLKQAI